MSYDIFGRDSLYCFICGKNKLQDNRTTEVSFNLTTIEEQVKIVRNKRKFIQRNFIDFKKERK